MYPNETQYAGAEQMVGAGRPVEVGGMQAVAQRLSAAIERGRIEQLVA